MIIYPPIIATRLQDDIDDSQTRITLLSTTNFLETGGVLLNDLGEVILNDQGQEVFALVDWYYITFYDNVTMDYEVVRVIAVIPSTNEIIVDRGIGSFAARAFSENVTAVIRWPVGNDWEDLRDEFFATYSTTSDVTTAVENFLIESAIQTLIDTSLIPYITTEDFEILISDFRTEAQSKVLINSAIQSSGITTPLNINTIFSTTFNADVKARDLQSSGTVLETLDIALKGVDFLKSVEITDNDEPFGILDGSGTFLDNLTIDWQGQDPSDIADIPANIAHTAITDGSNPHNVDTIQVRTLSTDPSASSAAYLDQFGFVPTNDNHPATRLYTDQQVALISGFLLDTTGLYTGLSALDLDEVPNESGIMVFGKDETDITKNFVHVWQLAVFTGLGGTGQGLYTINLNHPLDHIPVSVSAIVDVTGLSGSARIDAGLEIYVEEVGINFINIVLDTSGSANGLQGNSFVVRVEYYGILTI